MDAKSEALNVVLILTRREVLTLLDLTMTERLTRGDRRASVLSAEDKLAAAVRSQILGEKL